jgi:L-malate glycosyltransferase
MNNTTSSTKLNIIIIRVVSEFYPAKGGSITHVIELINAINSYLYKQLLIAPIFNTIDDTFDEKFSIPIIRVKSRIFKFNKLNRIPFMSDINLLFYSFRSILMIRKIIKKENKENQKIIVHVHNLLVGEFLMILSKVLNINFSIVIMQHGSPFYRERKTIRSKIKRKFMCSVLIFFKPNYYLNFNDGTISQRFVDILNKERIKNKIVNHAIDTDFFKPTDNEKKDYEFTILSNHRLDKYKRVDLSIKIFKCFMEKSGYAPNIKLKIIGDGPLREELKELTRSLNLNNYVIFGGEKNIEETKKEINSADIVIGTSLVSNINRSIQEAMSCNKPAIIFASGKVDEFFVNRENIVLITPNNIEEFADKIQLLWENRELREKIGNNARNLILTHRNWEQRVQQEIEVYKELSLV